MKKIISLAMLFFALTFNPHAYARWQECKQTLKQARTDSFFDFFASLFVTTTSYTTSSSRCRSWAVNQPLPVSKEIFFAENFHLIKPEASGGQGEYLDTFLAFYDLSFEQQERFKEEIRRNYTQIFLAEGPIENILLRIDNAYLALL